MTAQAGSKNARKETSQSVRDLPFAVADALANAVAKALRDQGHAMGKYGMNSGPQGYLPLREFIAANLKRRADMDIAPFIERVPGK